MSSYFRIITVYLDKAGADYLSFEDPEEIRQMSHRAPDWIKVLKGGETRFYPPHTLKVLTSQELGFLGNRVTDFNEQIAQKGYLGLNNQDQIQLMQQMRPDWLKVITKNEVKFYPPTN